MTPARRRVAVPALALAALTVLTACGSGGFAGPAPTPTPKKIENYVALGDGFSSAPYLGPDTSGTGCRRSGENYPAQVAREISAVTLTDVTCVGATTQNLTTKDSPPDAKRKLAAQLDAVTQDTDLVTIGIGIEDKGLLQNMFRICESEPCGDDVLAPPMYKQLDTYGAAFTAAIRTIQDISPTALVVVVGYPQLMPARGTCSALPPMSDTQLGYASLVLTKLNTLMRAATQQTGAKFVDVAELSKDHTACSDDPWVNGYKTTKGTKQGFGPVAAEQEAVAQAVLDQIRIATGTP